MTDNEFQTIAEQIAELEGALQDWDIRGVGATACLPWLHGIIVQLMEASKQTADDDQAARVNLPPWSTEPDIAARRSSDETP